MVGFRIYQTLDSEYEWVPIVMAEDFEPKYVGLVAAIIGIVVLLLGFAGVVVNLS